MAVKLEGLKRLETAFENLQHLAAVVRENLEEKRSWFDDKSEKWQESEKGVELSEHLDAVESFIDDIENLEFPV